MKYIYILLSLMLLSCDSENKQVAVPSKEDTSHVIELTNEQFSNSSIQCSLLQWRDISEIVRVNGLVKLPPQSAVSVSVPYGGFLSSTDLVAGARVSRGDVIATVEDQEYITLQQDFLLAKETLAFREQEFKRQEELNQSKSTSDKVFQQVRADFNSQKIVVKALGEKLKLLGLDPNILSAESLSRSIRVYAPISGFVTKVNVNKGMYFDPSTVLFEIVNVDDCYLSLQVFEKELGKLQIGQKLTAFTNANPGKKYECEVLLIGKDISVENNAEVICKFVNIDDSILPGVFMNAEIRLQSKSSPAIPSDAIVRFEGLDYVFAKRNERSFELVKVKTLVQEAGYAQFAVEDSAMLHDREFVVSGAYTLLMALKNSASE